MDIKQIEQIAVILKKEDIEEFEWKDGGFFLKMKRRSACSTVPSSAIAHQSQSNKEDIIEIEPIKTEDVPEAGNIIITSPIIGTFYRAPSPTSDPFVRPGDNVVKGQVLCIIEAMKLLNELEAEFPCEIIKILVNNGQSVEFGEALFEVRPLVS